MASRPFCRKCKIRRVWPNPDRGRVNTCATCRVAKMKPETDDPTQEEVDVLVMTRMKCLPTWWDIDTQRLNGPYYTRPIEDDADRRSQSEIDYDA